MRDENDEVRLDQLADVETRIRLLVHRTGVGFPLHEVLDSRADDEAVNLVHQRLNFLHRHAGQELD